jgi:hypothetical protein
MGIANGFAWTELTGAVGGGVRRGDCIHPWSMELEFSRGRFPRCLSGVFVFHLCVQLSMVSKITNPTLYQPCFTFFFCLLPFIPLQTLLHAGFKNVIFSIWAKFDGFEPNRVHNTGILKFKFENFENNKKKLKKLCKKTRSKFKNIGEYFFFKSLMFCWIKFKINQKYQNGST